MNFNLIAVVESSKPVAAVEASQATLSQAAVAPVTKKADGEDSLSPFSSDDENAAANKPRKCCFSHFGVVVLHGTSLFNSSLLLSLNTLEVNGNVEKAPATTE